MGLYSVAAVFIPTVSRFLPEPFNGDARGRPDNEGRGRILSKPPQQARMASSGIRLERTGDVVRSGTDDDAYENSDGAGSSIF